MVSHKIIKLPKNTLEITIEISPDEIEKEYQKSFDIIHKELAVQGFRKGKVPKTIAEKHISKESVYQELLKTLIPRIYREIVEKEALKPVISPKIELVKAKERKKDEHPTPSGQRNGTEVEGYSVYDQLLISDPKNMMDDLEEIKDGKTGKQVNRVANLIKYLESGEFERAVEKQKEWLLLKAKKAGISKYDLENFDEESAIGSL